MLLTVQQTHRKLRVFSAHLQLVELLRARRPGPQGWQQSQADRVARYVSTELEHHIREALRLPEAEANEVALRWIDGNSIRVSYESPLFLCASSIAADSDEHIAGISRLHRAAGSDPARCCARPWGGPDDRTGPTGRGRGRVVVGGPALGGGRECRADARGDGQRVRREAHVADLHQLIGAGPWRRLFGRSEGQV